MKEIGMDKWLHGVACLAIVAVVALVMNGVVGLRPNAACGAVGVAAALAAGLAKELWDVRRTGFSWGDLAADGVGAVVGFLFALMM